MWSEPGVYRYITGKPSDREQSWARLVRYHGFWPMLGYGFWAIEHEGRYVGEAGIANFGRDMDPPLGDTPEAGWALHPAEHGKGFATEALAAVLDWTDRNIKQDSIVAMVDVGNDASLKLATKCGFLPGRPATYHGEPVTLLERPLALDNCSGLNL